MTVGGTGIPNTVGVKHFFDFEQKFNDDNQRCEGGEDVSSYSTVINSG